MSLLKNAKEIWLLKPTTEDLQAGAEYASITLPWTFNRMMLNSSSAGQQRRALNIAKGIVAQEMLRRKLSERGVNCPMQRKSHRDEDLFDFHITINRAIRRLDIKTINYYKNYADVGRKPLSRELIIDNAAYPGPDWRLFFPMLVPHTQIKQEKEAYCFAIAESIDIRNDRTTDRVGDALTAFPYGDPLPFLMYKRLCLAREDNNQGVYIRLRYKPAALLDSKTIECTVIGEWDGKLVKTPVTLKANGNVTEIGPFSCICAFQINTADYNNLYGHIEIAVKRNDFEEAVYNSARQNINVAPDNPLILRRDDFCNLILPSHYTLYVIGWLPKDEFLQQCRQYTGWVWPLDKINKYNNQTWTQITERDAKTLDKAGFSDCIQDKPRLLKAGWMKTTGIGGGACCFVFPNVGSKSGVKETNLYVLPKDLHTMDTLGI